MSLLKRIMSPFVEFRDEDENQAPGLKPQAQATNNATTTRIVSHTQVTTPAIASSPVAVPAASSGAYQKHFEDLIEEANSKNPLFQGTDFKEFLDSKVDVEAISDEATKYKTAFNVLRRTGLTKEKLVTTGQEYINIIENDLKGFDAAYTQQYKADVEQKEELLQQKAAEIQALSEKISILNQELKQISQAVTASKEKLNSNKSLFFAAGANKIKELQSELKKIDQYF